MSKRPLEDYSESPDKSANKPDPGAEEKPREKGALPFKNPSFQHSNVVAGRKKPWRTLKQILAAEALLDWPQVWLESSAAKSPKLKAVNKNVHGIYYLLVDKVGGGRPQK